MKRSEGRTAENADLETLVVGGRSWKLIARELEDAVPIIKTMLEREEKEAEERRRKWEVEREKIARIEAERRRVEEEKARIAELKKQIEDWRFVQVSNVVETALAKALVLATEARRWDVVVQIAEELGRRRPRQTGEQGTCDRSRA